MRVPDHILGLLVAGAIAVFVVLRIMSAGVADNGHDGFVKQQGSGADHAGGWRSGREHLRLDRAGI